MLLPAVLLLLLLISSSTSSSAHTPSPPQHIADDFFSIASIHSASCGPPHVLSRCITLALRLRTSTSLHLPPLISHAAVTGRLSTLLSPSALAAAAVHSTPSTSSSYTACLTLASSLLTLRLLPVAVQLARACAVVWPGSQPPAANVESCMASLQQCVLDAVTCSASAATQAQHAAHGSITNRLQRPLCALPALLVYLSIFSRPSPPPALIMQGAQACVSASLFHCGFLLLARLVSTKSKPPPPCLVTWVSIMSMRLPPPPFPPHMFTPNCIPPLLLLAQGSHGVGGAAAHTLANLWPLHVPPSSFVWSVWGQQPVTAPQQLLVMQVPPLHSRVALRANAAAAQCCHTSFCRVTCMLIQVCGGVQQQQQRGQRGAALAPRSSSLVQM